MAVAPSMFAGLIGVMTGGSPTTAAVAVAGGLAAAEIRIDRETVEAVRVHLVQALNILQEAQGKMSSIPASAAGGSPYAASLVHHSQLASAHLLETIASMRQGLADYDSAMDVWLKDVEGIDEQILADLQQGQQQIEAGFSDHGQGAGA